MISYHLNYFQVFINMSQEPIELYPPRTEAKLYFAYTSKNMTDNDTGKN